jgi:hypothetical protein
VLSDWKHGGASRDRTDDLIVANDALSQLSYSPTRAQHQHFSRGGETSDATVGRNTGNL